jgi:uncharacterized protein involved in exopolysaccharide biosynthesis
VRANYEIRDVKPAGQAEAGGPPASGTHPAYADGRRAAESGEPSDRAGAGIDLRFLFGILRRHKYLILGLVVLITGCAALYVEQLTPLYRAQAQIVLDPDRRNIVPVQKVVRDFSVDWQTARTEAAVIGSYDLARQAVRRLDLAESRMFNPKPDTGGGQSPGVADRLQGLVREGIGDVRL